MPTTPAPTAHASQVRGLSEPDRAAGVRALARLLDSAVGIPGTKLRFGLDALIGLVPGLGDMAGAALSGYIVLASARLGAPTPVLVRMILNVAIDAVIGSVPLLGDLFDVGWRANTRNTTLLDHHLEAPGATRKGSIGVIVGVVAVLVLLAAGALALTIAVVKGIGALIAG